jgi:tape measure domain-containing protein
MAVVADRVVVELEAKIDRYSANVRAAEQRFNAATRNIQRSAQTMERSIERNTRNVGNQIRGMAATLAAAFTVQQVAALADGYTRFTNQLAVAGIEGENLARVQGQIFEIAQRNGVQMEALGSLYGRVTQSAKDLGASQADILKLTSGVAAGLRVQGASAEKAAGAILGLVQALGSTTVKAEEFNQINEGAPALLQGVADNIDKAGGSISRLRALVVDQKVTNDEFFRAFLAGSDALEARAAKASLTIANSFTILNNALGMYIGQTDDSLSATERISQAIILLAENLDTVTKALGLLAAVLLGRFVGGMVAAAGATGLVSTAIFAMQARVIGAATTMEALALTSRVAGASMLAAFGGPVGLAVAALAVGIYYLATRTDDAAQASAVYAQQQAQLKAIQDKTADATDKLATATGKARAEAIANAKALRQETIQYLENARAALIAAKAKASALAREQNLNRERLRIGGNDPRLLPGVGPEVTRERKAQADADVRVANANVAGADKELKRLESILKAPPAVANITPTGDGKKKPKGAQGRSGPDPEELERRFLDDMARGHAEYQAALAEATGTREAQVAQLQLEIDTDNEIRRRAIEADDDLTDARKAQLLALSDQVALARHQAVLAQQRQEAEEGALAIAQGALGNEREVLEAQARLADTSAERRDLELRILELQYQEERARLEAVVNNLRINAADREIARQRLAMLGRLEAADRAQVERQNEGPAARYMRELNARDINEQLDEVRVAGLQRLEDQIVSTTSKIFKLGGAFGEVANQIIADLIRIAVQRAIIEPLANMMFGAPNSATTGSGSGGWLSSLINVGMAFAGSSGGGSGSVFGMNPSGGAIGMASGGHVNAGTIYRVNETGIEGFQPGGSGKIIPLGQMNKATYGAPTGGPPALVRLIVAPNQYFDLRVQSISGNVAVETVNAAAPALTEMAVSETFRVAGRPEM